MKMHPSYSAFLAQYLTRSRAEGIKHPYDDPEVPVPALRQVRRLIVERVSYVPPDVLRLRVGLCKLMFLNMLMRRDSRFPMPDRDISLPSLVDDTLEQMTAALTAPCAAMTGWTLFDGLSLPQLSGRPEAADGI